MRPTRFIRIIKQTLNQRGEMRETQDQRMERMEALAKFLFKPNTLNYEADSPHQDNKTNPKSERREAS